MTAKERIAQLVRENPGQYTIAQLARETGVSRQWARVVIQSLGLQDFIRSKQRMAFPELVTVKCAHCGKEFNIRKADYNRRLARNQRRFFCSVACRQNFWRELLATAWKNPPHTPQSS